MEKGLVLCQSGTCLLYTSLLLGLSLALALMLCACDSGTPSTEPAADPSATDSGPRTDLNLSSTEAVETLDPHYTARSADRAVEFQIYEPLYLIDDDSSEIPLLATDYSVSEDGLTYTFNLRQGVLFHNCLLYTSSGLLCWATSITSCPL